MWLLIPVRWYLYIESLPSLQSCRRSTMLSGWQSSIKGMRAKCNNAAFTAARLEFANERDSQHLEHTVYPKKYAHGFVVLCFVVVMQSFIMYSHEVFIHIHQGCFAGTGAIVRLPQCQWSNPDGYGKISQCITTTKHSKAKTVCISLGIYCVTASEAAFGLQQRQHLRENLNLRLLLCDICETISIHLHTLLHYTML